MRQAAAVSFVVAGLAQLVQAGHLYLNPSSASYLSSSSSSGIASPDHASRALAHHLGLEAFEALGAADSADFLVNGAPSQPFVAQGQRDGLLLTIDERDAKDILPSSMKPVVEIPTPPLDSLTELVNTYAHRAAQTFARVYTAADAGARPPPRMLDVFSASGASGDTFISELTVLVDFLESPPVSGGKFGALELRGLRALADAHGRDSDAYRTAAEAGRAIIESALASPDLQLAVVTFAPDSGTARRAAAPQQSPLPGPKPHEPIGTSARCFETAEACGNATDSCSGHGQCMSARRSGKTCFVCACGTTKTERGATEYWVGEQCERKDISSSFTLITGTVLGLIVLIGGSISLLYSVGNIELPGTLTSTAGTPKRD